MCVLVWWQGTLHALSSLQSLPGSWGLVNKNGAPTQAHGGTVRAQGVVPGASVDLPIVHTEYQIKGDTLAIAFTNHQSV